MPGVPSGNPKTGETLKIKAGKSVRFKASPTLKNAMKGRRAAS
jgi:nucleoid DNA-binding protein